MTRVKVKVLSRHLPDAPTPAPAPSNEYSTQSYTQPPVGHPRVGKKRQRSPLPVEQPRHRPSPRFHLSDSAHDTSSCQSSDEKRGVPLKSRHLDHDDWADITGSSSSHRGTIRLKVKPCKDPDSIIDSSLSDGANHQMSHHYSTEKSVTSRNGTAAGGRPDIHRRPEINVNELGAALTVLRKIMRMEAAEPFNSPVDPIALGIPDYLDIVKTPMDLGTICQNLETGVKYRNSSDVYSDVQLVWTNCRLYNQKGDPILELLTRVKKNFMKYWTAAGLYTERTPGPVQDKHIQIAENHLVRSPKNNNLSPLPKGSDAYSGKHRRASGTGHHKEDCACAVCAGIRRKLAREGKPVVTDASRTQERKTQIKIEPTTSLKIQPESTRVKVAKAEVDTVHVDARTDVPLRAAKEEVTPDESLTIEDINQVDILDEDIEDIKHELEHDEGVADMPCNGTEPSEGGTQFYQTSYEIPLRKVHPAVLRMSQRLFGSHSLWHMGYHIRNHMPKRSLQNPILKTVSFLLRTKSTKC